MIKYSIIVPVYNVEKYIYQCINSICNQNFDNSNFETIIVNDGTKDNSIAIIKDLIKEKKNFYLINQTNKGLGEARNTGITYANGEYLIFLDSDDYFFDSKALYYINKKIDELRDVDVLCYNHYLFNEKTKKIYDYKKNIYRNINCIKNNEKRIKIMIRKDLYSISAWSKVVKKSVITKNKILFNKILSEDIDWSARILMATKKIYYLNKSINVYRINREGSITCSKEKIFDNLKKAVINSLMYYNQNNNICYVNYILYINTIFKSLIILYIKGEKKFDNKKFILDNKNISKQIYDFKSFFCFIYLCLFIK